MSRIAPNERLVALSQLLDYELRSSWWAPWVGWGPLQWLVGHYFVWKTRRKCRRYERSKADEVRFKNKVFGA